MLLFYVYPGMLYANSNMWAKNCKECVKLADRCLGIADRFSCGAAMGLWYVKKLLFCV